VLKNIYRKNEKEYRAQIFLFLTKFINTHLKIYQEDTGICSLCLRGQTLAEIGNILEVHPLTAI